MNNLLDFGNVVLDLTQGSEDEILVYFAKRDNVRFLFNFKTGDVSNPSEISDPFKRMLANDIYVNVHVNHITFGYIDGKCFSINVTGKTLSDIIIESDDNERVYIINDEGLWCAESIFERNMIRIGNAF